MDMESRLQKIEAEVHQIRILVWIVLALVLSLSVGFLPTAVSFGSTLGVLALVYLLVTAASGWRRFRSTCGADAQLQDKILREVVAERAKTQRRDEHP